MFKKKSRKDTIWVDAKGIDNIIDEVLEIEDNLNEIEKIIEFLKHDTDAVKFNKLLTLLKWAEKKIERFKNDVIYGAASRYIERASDRLECAKRNVQLILYGAKFGDTN